MLTTVILMTALGPAITVQGDVGMGRSKLGSAVVSLEGGSVQARPLSGVVIDQRGKEFVPHITAITPGTKIRFPNNDIVYHNVFAHYDAARFDLGVYPKGAVKDKTFLKTGVVSLLCSIHSEMSAYIVIVDTPYFAVTKRDGSFKIPDVEPGTYTLKLWHETGASATQKVTVSQGMAKLSVEARR